MPLADCLLDELIRSALVKQSEIPKRSCPNSPPQTGLLIFFRSNKIEKHPILRIP